MTRYRVFISSTIEDLKDARAEVDAELCATEIFEAVRVENLPAVDEPSRRVCLDEVIRADALVLILGDRYGFIPTTNNPDNLSVSHLEYREAKRLGKPVFAFLHEKSSPEEQMAEFIKEVSDFDEGVVRKKWISIENLRFEVRRALLFWLARRARDSDSSEIQQQFETGITRYPDVWELQCVIESGYPVSKSLREWLDDVFRHFVIACNRLFLPVPRRLDGSETRKPGTAIRFQLSPNIQSARLSIVVDLIEAVPGASKRSKQIFPPPIELDVGQGPEVARFVAKCCTALTYLVVDDWKRCIDGLFDTATSNAATEKSRARLVGTAGYVSAFNQGQKSFDVARRMLQLPRLDGPTVSAGIIALVTAELRFKNARAQYALSQAEHLAMQLLMAALKTGASSPEVLYNLARQSFNYSSRLALSFFSELLRTDPSYDERWYFHRDLGLIHYRHNDYKEAAQHYDLACHLKQNDSEILRFAGDSYYYRGWWSEALLCYERAVQIEPVERYFLDFKIDFARQRIRRGVEKDQRFEVWRKVSNHLSRIGVKFAETGYRGLARRFFILAKKISDLNFDADSWLALYANRQGRHDEAIFHLRNSLSWIPEDPSARLNLVVNMIFRENGRFPPDCLEHAKAAIFHGGPESRDRFRLRLVNTPNREDLCREFDEVFFEQVKYEREGWQQRRKEVLRPERFGGAVHFEWRP